MIGYGYGDPVYPMYTTHPKVIERWAGDIMRNRLYRPDGIAQHSFTGKAGKIVALAYIPGVAWVMLTERTDKENLPLTLQAFTHAGYRRQGFMERLVNAYFPEYRKTWISHPMRPDTTDSRTTLSVHRIPLKSSRNTPRPFAEGLTEPTYWSSES